MAITSFVFGLLSIALSFLPFFVNLPVGLIFIVAVATSILGYAFGLYGVVKRNYKLKGAAWFGVIISAVAFTASLLFYFSGK